MSSSFFYCQEGLRDSFTDVVAQLEELADEMSTPIYLLNKPLGDTKYKYSYNESLVVLIPKHKIMILNFGDDGDEFDDYAEDFLEDLGSISDKYEYKSIIGRPRNWRSEIVYQSQESIDKEDFDLDELLSLNQLVAPNLQKKGELLISLLTGSINDINRVRDNIPDNILEKIKQKILLFDGDQTRFVYQENTARRVTIQGLSGTGKTELLLHKLKEIYLVQSDSKILFTCHNKILATNLKKRIPDFFNFMKVEQQIEWDERLWCVHAWGSANNINSGAYRYICSKYGIPFHTFSYSMPFSRVCRLAIDELTPKKIEKEGYAFDYVLLDESQDFPLEFIELCELVTKKTVYVAGDIFQSIFDETIISEVRPDFLLSKCYRTDPRTLMFAHALGMGLFETEKLRWLNDEEWEACGYLIDKNKERYRLSRAPLRRFEDLASEKIPSMEIIKTSFKRKSSTNDYAQDAVIKVIKKITEQNPTATAEDIGIVFTGSNKRGYALADILENLIPQHFEWTVNKAYETKVKVKDTVFISNKNNVKGLEFPFVICVSDYISDAPHERNALYMLLTRSFIQSFLLVSDSEDDDKISSIIEGLEYINKNTFIETTIPTQEEKDKIKTRISYDKDKKSIHELSINVFDELDVPAQYRGPLLALIKEMKATGLNYDKIRSLVITNVELMEGK